MEYEDIRSLERIVAVGKNIIEARVKANADSSRHTLVCHV